MHAWKPWQLWDGTPVMVPQGFEPIIDPSGDILIRNFGDPDGPFAGRMPREGYYFDMIGDTGMSASLTLPDPSEYARSLRPLDDEELDFAARISRELYDTTDYALLGEFWAGGLGLPEGMNKGYFVRPTVFADVTPGMTIEREEIFGPVLSIIPFRDEEEAVRIANDTPSGYPPQRRITTVMTPHPTAKMILPVFVIGEVTMSVAMKKAPSMSPPATR